MGSLGIGAGGIGPVGGMMPPPMPMPAGGAGGIPNLGMMVPHLENLKQMDEASLNSVLF
jgi:hypothetical protein